MIASISRVSALCMRTSCRRCRPRAVVPSSIRGRSPASIGCRLFGHVAANMARRLSKTVALEYAEAIKGERGRPGYVRTRMTEDVIRRRGDAILAQTPLKRMGSR